MPLNSHDYDEIQTVSLKDLSENGKEKLAGLSDEELEQLKQQAVEAEDYDIAKMIKQEQVERKERVPETEELTEKKRDDDTEYKTIQEEKDASHEENLKKADNLINQLNDWEENNKNEKDELLGLLGENQKRYLTLSEDDKKKFRIFYSMSKILDNYQEDINKYEGNRGRLNDLLRYWDNFTDRDWREHNRLEKEAQHTVENLERDINQYKRMHRTEIENAKMWQLFEELKNMFDKGLFKEKSYMWVLGDVVDVLQDLNKYTKDEQKFKKFRH